MKKETVIGIIGKTQGVSKAAKPLIKAIKKSAHMLFPSFSSEVFFVSSTITPPSTPFISKENSTSSGGKH